MVLWRKKTERDRLLEVRPRFRVIFSRSQVAASHWDYGEDDLAVQAIGMTDEDLASIRRIDAWLEDPSYPLPLEGQRQPTTT